MHYNILSDIDIIDVHYYKTLPQFAGMTDADIKTLIAKVNRIEKLQAEVDRDNQLKKERAADQAYLEEHRFEGLPNGAVEIANGIIVTPSMVDDRGFVSHDKLQIQRKTMRMSLEEEPKKKIYI